MNVLATLIRREFWEHRSLWITPLAVAGLLVLLAAVGSTASTGPNVHFEINGQEQLFLDSLTPDKRTKLFGLLVGGLLLPQLVAMLAVVLFYALDCLYAERKDRSILFWKSLPVSDVMTVWAKFLTAIAVVPLGVYALSLVTSVLSYGLITLRLSGTPFAGFAEWDTLVWLRTQLVLLADTFIAALWYAPVVAALLLASAWVRRSPITWVTLVPLAVMFVERRTFGTSYVAALLNHRLTGFFSALGVNAQRTGTMPDVAAMYQKLDATSLLASPELWLGVVVAVALLYAAARLRRDRDDT